MSYHDISYLFTWFFLVYTTNFTPTPISILGENTVNPQPRHAGHFKPKFLFVSKNIGPYKSKQRL